MTQEWKWLGVVLSRSAAGAPNLRGAGCQGVGKKGTGDTLRHAA